MAKKKATKQIQTTDRTKSVKKKAVPKKDAMKKPTLQDLLIYEPKYQGSDQDMKSGFVSVKLRENLDDRYGRPLCTLHGREENVWIIYECSPSDFLDHVRYLRLPTKELAAATFYAIRQKVSEIVENKPLPQDVIRYLEERSRHLREREQALLAEFWQIRSERWQLRQFAEKNQISSVYYQTEDTDQEAAVRKLLEFEVWVPKKAVCDLVPDGENDAYEKVPFVSEAALYNLVGKQDARTALVMINDILEMVAPNTARGA